MSSAMSASPARPSAATMPATFAVAFAGMARSIIQPVATGVSSPISAAANPATTRRLRS